MTEDAITTKPKQGGVVSVARQRVALLAFLLIVFAISERLLWLGNSYERTPWWAAAIFPLFALGATTQ